MQKKPEPKPPAHYLFAGLGFFILGLGMLSHLVKPISIFDIIAGISGFPLIIGAIILLKCYRKRQKV